MAQGVGKYDEACTVAMELADAQTVLLMVLHGKYGHGFSVQTHDSSVAASLPGLLREMADVMEQHMKKAAWNTL